MKLIYGKDTITIAGPGRSALLKLKETIEDLSDYYIVNLGGLPEKMVDNYIEGIDHTYPFEAHANEVFIYLHETPLSHKALNCGSLDEELFYTLSGAYDDVFATFERKGVHFMILDTEEDSLASIARFIIHEMDLINGFTDNDEDKVCGVDCDTCAENCKNTRDILDDFAEHVEESLDKEDKKQGEDKKGPKKK